MWNSSRGDLMCPRISGDVGSESESRNYGKWWVYGFGVICDKTEDHGVPITQCGSEKTEIYGVSVIRRNRNWCSRWNIVDKPESTHRDSWRVIEVRSTRTGHFTPAIRGTYPGTTRGLLFTKSWEGHVVLVDPSKLFCGHGSREGVRTRSHK